jgi:hypothetical protein
VKRPGNGADECRCDCDSEFVCHPAKRGWFIDDAAIVKLGAC